MLKKILGYGLLAVAAYITFLIVLLPADVAWRFARSQISSQQLPVQVLSLDGTVWHGSGNVFYQGLYGKLFWHLQPWRILIGDPVLQLQLSSPAGELNATAGTSWRGLVAVSVKGRVGLSALNPLLANNRVSLDGYLDVRDLQVHWNSQERKLLSADGRLQWTGGTVGYPVAGEMQRQEMPALIGLVFQRGRDVVLDVKDNPNNLGVAEVVVQEDGVAKVAVRRKLLDLAGAPWSTNSNSQDIVFRVQQKLF